MRFVIIVAASAALTMSAFAQPAGTGGAPPTSTPPASSQPSNNPAPTPTEPAGGQSATPTSSKHGECRKAARDQNLSGPDLRDHMQICMLEARLNCLKQAVDQKVRAGRPRRRFMRRCMG